MKTNILKYFTLTVAVAMFTACSDDNEGNGGSSKVPVNITTSVNTRVLTSVTTDIEKDGETMTAFLSTSNTVAEGETLPTSTVTRQGGKWTGSPAIEVGSDESLYIFATYPAAANAGTPDAVTVDVASQTDYLYSGTAQRATAQNPNVTLTMKHAMSILAFNIQGTGRLESIGVSGEPIYTQGTLNVTNGDIQGTTTGSYVKDCGSMAIVEGGWTENIPDLFCIPFISSGTDVMITFTIDGKSYECALPKYSIVGGVKYIFDVDFHNGKIFISDTPTPVALNHDEDEMSIGDYTKVIIANNLDADNLTFTAPSFGGTNLMGNINWGDGSTETFRSGMTHTYGEAGQHAVEIEIWGAEDVKINSLHGVEQIDLSNF